MIFFTKCLQCGNPLHELDHGNRKRCNICSLIFKRQSNKFRQSIIRAHGNQGWYNLMVLEQLTIDHKHKFPIFITTSALLKRGFIFPNGFIHGVQNTPIIISFGKHILSDYLIQHDKEGYEISISKIN